MKKVIAVISALILTISAIMSIGFAGGSEVVLFYYSEDIEVIVEKNGLSYDEMRNIADVVAGVSLSDSDTASPSGITCTLFGHKYTTSSVTKITHNAYTVSPKCLKEIYEVSTCSRCGHIEEVLTSSRRIVCH